MKKSAFVSIINSNKTMKVKEEGSPVPVKSPIEEKKDEVLTDNEGSLKVPSLKDFNLSNKSLQDNQRFFLEDRLSDSSLSNKMAHYGLHANLIDKVTDGVNDEGIQNLEKIYSLRKNTRNENYFKRLSAASLFWHNHMMNKQQNKESSPGDIKFQKELSKNSDEKNSLRMQINNMHPDQIELIKSVSRLSQIANYDYDLNKNLSCTTLNKNEAGEKNENLKNMTTTGLNDLSMELRHDALSLENNEDYINDTERFRGHSILSNNGDFSLINGPRKYSKRNSLISNLSLLLGKPDNRDDQ